MNKIFNFFLILLIFWFLQSCSDVKKGLGMEKDVPDEFLIKRNDDLQKPPNYDLLPPGTLTQQNSQKKKDNDVKKMISKSINDNIANKETIKTDADANSSIENDILNQIKK